MRVLGSLKAPQKTEALLVVYGIGRLTESGTQVVRERKGFAANFITVEFLSFIFHRYGQLVWVGHMDRDVSSSNNTLEGGNRILNLEHISPVKLNDMVNGCGGICTRPDKAARDFLGEL